MDISTIEHASITADNRVSLQSHMDKFDSFEAAAVDGMALKGLMGKPFKFPESMDKLPDDTSRAEFSLGANKLLGREFASDIAGLDGLDMKLNSTSDVMDEGMASAFKQFIVEGKISKADAQKSVGFYNKAMSLTRERMAAATKEVDDKFAAEHIVAVRTCNEAMVAHESYGSQEEVDKQTVLLHRALKDNIGISTERAEEVSEFLKSGVGATDPIVRHAMLQTFSKLATESSTEGPGTGTAAAEVKMSAEEAEKDKAVKKVLGWK